MLLTPDYFQRSTKTLGDYCLETISTLLLDSTGSEVAQIATEDDLRQFVNSSFGITVPDVQVCPDHTTPWRAFCDAYFAKNSVSLWIASRGFGGKSFLLALLGLTEAATLKVDVNVLGGSGEQSTRVHEYMQKFWNYPHAPRHLLLSDPTQLRTKLLYGNSVHALMASTRSVRGPHPARLRLDELDEMDRVVFEASLGQPMSQRGVKPQLVLSSTHHYADGTMTYALKLAADRGWPCYQWCYKESMAGGEGWLDEEEVETKRRDIPAAMWQVEYELQEPSPEARAITEDDVRAMFDKSLGQVDGVSGDFIFEEPVPQGRYSHGADWARKVDHTVIVTLRVDVDPMRIVAFYRGQRQSWPRMVSIFDKRKRLYGGNAAHDGTGLGDVVDQYIEESEDVEAFIMSGKRRSDLLSEYIAGIENGDLISPYIGAMEGEHRLASQDDVYGSGHLPDTISAGALAYRAAKNSAVAQSSDHMEHGQIDDYVSPWG